MEDFRTTGREREMEDFHTTERMYRVEGFNITDRHKGTSTQGDKREGDRGPPHNRERDRKL